MSVPANDRTTVRQLLRLNAYRLLLWPLLFAYVFGLSVSIPYCNWRYVRDHGTLAWIVFSGTASTAEHIYWPLHAATTGTTPTHAADELVNGQAYAAANNWDAAIASYSRAIEIAPTLVDAYISRAHAFMKSGQDDRALRDVGIATRLMKEDEKLHTRYARAHDKGVAAATTENWAVAKFCYSAAIGIDPSRAEAYNGRGEANAKLGDHAAAIVDFTRAIRLAPTNPAYYIHRGHSLDSANVFPLAIADYSQAIELDPTVHQAYNGRGISYSNIGQHTLAIKDLSDALRLAPDQPSYYMNRGLAHHRTGNLKKAEADFSIANTLGRKRRVQSD